MMQLLYISDFEISIKDFQLVRLDRNRHSGGVLIYVHSSLNWDVLLNGPNDREFLSLSITVICKSIGPPLQNRQSGNPC